MEHEAQNSKFLFTEDVGCPHLQLQGSPRLMDSLDTTRLADWIANQVFYKGKARAMDSSPTTRHGMAWLACQQIGIDSGHGLSLTYVIRDVSSQEWKDHSTMALIEFELHDGCIQMKMDA